MAKFNASGASWSPAPNNKRTSIGRRNIKTSTMNKSKRRSFKSYRGQGQRDMSDNFFDFGFTAVDENELEAVQQAASVAQESNQTVDQLEAKIDRLYNAITPLLSNLKKDPHKEYILWPDRLSRIEQFEEHLQKILGS